MIEHRLRVAGETLVLHAERAAWWKRQRTLLLADVHFGKGHVLRHAGIALPAGQTQHDLLRIDVLIDHYRPQRIVVLGDLVHGAAGADVPWVERVAAWRARHAAIAMVVVSGNHDRQFDAARIGFDAVAAPLLQPPFALCHEPRRIDGSYVLAGHVHPATTVRDGWRRHRVPAFRFDEHAGILPAFGSLTGLHEDAARPGERIVAVTPAGLIPLLPA